MNLTECVTCGATDVEIAKAREEGNAKFGYSCGCDTHGDHLGCSERCWDWGCEHEIGEETSCDHTRDPYRHPLQPVVFDPHGVARFKKNAIVDFLLDNGPNDMNSLAIKDFSAEDRMQFAQLIGYSVSGFGDLSYADPNVVAEADAVVEAQRD